MADEEEVLSVIDLEGSLEEAEKPPILPAGVYIGEVQDVQLPTSAKGNPYFAIKFKIPSEEIPPDIADQFDDGVDLYWNRQVVPKAGDRRAMWNLKNLIMALGLPTNTTQIDPNDWMGQRCKLKVKHGSYQGETRAEIASLDKADSGRPAAARGGKPAPRGRQVVEDIPDDDPIPAPRRGGRR